MKLAMFSLATLMITIAIPVWADPPANFTLQSAVDDTKFELAAHRGKFVVLHFLLKTECPYCLRYTQEYAQIASAQADVAHVFIKPDSVEEIKAWANNLDKTPGAALPKIYRDPDARLAKQLKIPDGYRFHGQSVHYPALILLDSAGKELFRYVGKSNSDRMPSKDFSAKLAMLKK